MFSVHQIIPEQTNTKKYEFIVKEPNDHIRGGTAPHTPKLNKEEATIIVRIFDKFRKGT